MRVLSWNVAHNDDMWKKLDELRAQEHFDIALLQEAKPPSDVSDDRTIVPDPANHELWKTVLPGLPREWRTAIASWKPLQITPIEAAPLHLVSEEDADRLPESYPGAFTAVRVAGTALVSVYGAWEHLPGSHGSYSIAAVHRTISDLTRLWYGEKQPRVVIAGDWNIWHKYGDRTPAAKQVRQWSTRHNSVFSRLDAEGLRVAGPYGSGPLERCPCGTEAECRHVQTYWHNYKDGATPYQTDFVMATPGIRISEPAVVTHLKGESVWAGGISDHAPVIFDISQ